MAGKNIIICSDGTGNRANKGRGTNVFKIFEAIDNSGHHVDSQLRRQIAFYDDGVGTSRVAPWRVLSGATGAGVARNVRQLYRHLCRSYRPDDRIYLFGFSRGAYTVRVLAALIIHCGIVDLTSPAKVRGPLGWLPMFAPGSSTWLRYVSWRAWRAHRRRYQSLLGKLVEFVVRGEPEDSAEKFRQRYARERTSEPRARIHFIGVWDTVGAVGLPFDFLTWIVNTFFYRFSFPNTMLSSRVEKACQALAIDEERASFNPELWSEADDAPDYNVRGACVCDGVTPPPANDEGGTEPRIEQLWFAGVHSDVGGGYPKQGLSYLTLDWMMEKAQACGLRFSNGARAAVSEQRNAFDKLHDSRAGMGLFYRYEPRRIGALCQANRAEVRVHGSALERVANNTNEYAPAPLPADTRVECTPGELFRDVDGLTKRVCEVKTDREIRWPVWTRIGTHWGLVAVVGWVVYAAAQSAQGWGKLGKVLVDNWSSPLVALQSSILPPLFDETLTAMGMQVLGLLVLIAVISLAARSAIAVRKAAFWRDVFSEHE